MLAHLRANLLLLGLTFVGCAVIYPAAIIGVGKAIFPSQAAGSLLAGENGEALGSRLVAQKFARPEWFHPRPSAADYNAAASAGSNLSANNPDLRKRVEETLKGRPEKADAPADAVTASGSGLDPHVTLRNARGQVERVVAAWVSKGVDERRARDAVEAALAGATHTPSALLAGGENLVNVLEANAALAAAVGK